MSHKISIIVELQTARHTNKTAANVSRDLRSCGFVPDLNFFPVNISPTTIQQETSLDAGHEQLVLIRGGIDSTRLDILKSQPAVVEVEIDSIVSPFDPGYGLPHSDDWLLDSSSECPVSCPIPPCDCNPAKSTGCLREIASYLGADELWLDGVNGQGIRIGIVDGGISADVRMDADIPGLVPSVVAGWPTAGITLLQCAPTATRPY